MRQLLAALCVAAPVVALSSCGRVDENAPPTIRYGQDECIGCGMILSEERSACAMLIERGGRHEHVMFDDLGCMLDYEQEKPAEARIVHRFVHGYADKAWLMAKSSVFILADADRLQTPMSSGIGAFADTSAAEKARGQYGGVVFTYDALGPARLKWREERFGKREDRK